METFRRFEKKYLLDEDQYQKLMILLEDHVVPDMFFESQISSIYYDNETDQLIRRSIEKPEYKEKLRIRAYHDAKDDEKVFVELKKKLDGIVYKRRTMAVCADVINDIYTCSFDDPQVGKEIRYVLDYYGKLSPKFYVGCERSSYASKDDPQLRITFDRDLRYRMEDLSLRKSDKDKQLSDKTVMELKVADAMPLWLSEILNEVKAYPRGFSKVGTAYLKELGA